MADRDKNVYCLISDGEAFEGTMWEVGNVKQRYGVDNLIVYMNYNGFAAYEEVDENFINRFANMLPCYVKQTNVSDYNLSGLSAHYVKL